MRTAPLVSRWIERLLAAHEPPFTVAQYLTLQAIADGEIVGAELARRAAVSPAAISQLLAALEDAGMLTRDRLYDDRRRQPLTLTSTASGRCARHRRHCGSGSPAFSPTCLLPRPTRSHVSSNACKHL